MEPLASAMTEDHTFNGCFDDCEPWWLPEEIAFGNGFPTGELTDFACTTSWSTRGPKHQTASPHMASAV